MEDTDHKLVAKACGMIDALGKLPAKELVIRPNVAFAKDYNRLRQMFIDAHPDHATVAPPEVEVVEDSLIPGVNATYVEILAYCQQLMNLLRHLEIDQHR